nr:protein prune homolog isoform X2 [Tanacetum cinerariifolium]
CRPMREGENVMWVWGQGHMGRSGEGLGTIQVRCGCTGMAGEEVVDFGGKGSLVTVGDIGNRVLYMNDRYLALWAKMRSNCVGVTGWKDFVAAGNLFGCIFLRSVDTSARLDVRSIQLSASCKSALTRLKIVSAFDVEHVKGFSFEDFGSFISTIMYACDLNEIDIGSQYCTVHVFNNKRTRLNSHDELKWLLNTCDIDHSSLLFIDDIYPQ